MGIRTNEISQRLPSPVFKNIEQLDRVRKYMLGLPVPRKGRTIPFGYKVSKTDPTMLEPVKLQFQLLVEAKKLLQEYSYKDVAAWLTENTGVEISDAGLHRIMELRRPDDRCLLPLKERLQV